MKSSLLPTMFALLIILCGVVFPHTLIKTVALVVLCLLVGFWVVLVLVLFVQRFSALPRGNISNWWKHFLRFLLSNGVLLVAALVAYFLRWANDLTGVPDYSSIEQILGGLLLAVEIGWIVFFLVAWYRTITRFWLKQTVYYGLTSAVTLSILYVALTFTQVTSRDHEWWYQRLWMLDNNPASEPSPVVLLDFVDGWPGEEPFLRLLSMLDSYEPRVIALAFHPATSFGSDSTVLARLINSVTHARFVSPDLDYFRVPGGGMKLVGRSWWTIFRDYPAMYYKPVGDLSQAILSEYRVAGGEAPDDGSVPVTEDGHTLIHYYSSGFPAALRFHRNLNWFEDGTRTYIFRSQRHSPRNQMLRVDFDQRRIMQSRTNDSYDFSEAADLSDLNGKIIIVNVPDMFNASADFMPWKSFGYTYATIIQNALERNFITQPTRGWLLVASGVVLGLFASLYARINPWKALAVSSLTSVLLFVALVVVFQEYRVYISPSPIFAFALGSLLFFFSHEITAERRRLLEERTRLSTELKAAREMQLGLMPKEDPAIKGFDISGVCIPANEVGGDFYDYVWMDERKTKLGIAVADVSGKAMKAAITAVMTSGMIYRELEGNQVPRTILQRINKPMYAKLNRGTFTAMSFAVIDIKKKLLNFSNAGQMRPIYKHGHKVVYIKADGLPLGVSQTTTYREATLKLKKDDLVVFYTDGVNEAINTKEEQYGLERLESHVAHLISGNTAKQIVESIMEDVKAFVGSAKQHDDMTVVVVKVV